MPRQLPADVSVFVKRRTELRRLGRLLTGRARRPAARSSRMPAAVVVITGSAGVGKTALALHWAHRIREQFPDGSLATLGSALVSRGHLVCVNREGPAEPGCPGQRAVPE